MSGNRDHREHLTRRAFKFETVIFLSCDICATLVSAAAEVTVVYQNGLPVISVSLPSRRERCQFTLKPLSDCVGVFLQQLQAEDRGIDRVAIYSTGTLTSTKVHTRAATIRPFVPSGFFTALVPCGFKWLLLNVVMAANLTVLHEPSADFFFFLALSQL